MIESDVLIVGGGVVGFAIGFGLRKRGHTVAIADDSNGEFRASLGNQGMVWCAFKGHDNRSYAKLTRRSIDKWSDFAKELQELTGIDCAYSRSGGFTIASSEEELEQFDASMKTLQRMFKGSDTPYSYELVDRAPLEAMYPGLGPGVPGAIHTEYEGICNPLLLSKALQQAFQDLGGGYFPFCKIHEFEAASDEGYVAFTADKLTRFKSKKVVLAAGLGTKELSAELGVPIPISPNRGQILVTERFNAQGMLPNNVFRPMEEGNVLIGASSDNVGYDASVDLGTSGNVAKRAMDVFPWLSELQVIRMWSALRVMTPDGKPVYEELATAPNVFVATCHSGITLAPTHASDVAEGIVQGSFSKPSNVFTTDRFFENPEQAVRKSNVRATSQPGF